MFWGAVALWGGQVRVGFGGAYALDAPAVADIAAAAGVDRGAALLLAGWTGDGVAAAVNARGKAK